jgi:hypothetical protein
MGEEFPAVAKHLGRTEFAELCELGEISGSSVAVRQGQASDYAGGVHIDVDAPEPLDGGADTGRYYLAASDVGAHADGVPELRRDLIG